MSFRFKGTTASPLFLLFELLQPILLKKNKDLFKFQLIMSHLFIVKIVENNLE